MTTDPAVRQMHLEGCLRWPSITVTLETLETFGRSCERMSGSRVPSAEIRRHAADIYLCCACVSGDRTAQRLFEREAHEVALGAIERVHRDREFVREWLEQARERILNSVRNELSLHGTRLTDSEFRSVARVVGQELELEFSSRSADTAEHSSPMR